MGRKVPDRLIVQIAPATPGFYAVYGDKGERSSFAPVAAWVVVEDEDGDRWVEGIDPVGEGWTGHSAETMSNFQRYVHSHVPLDSDGTEAG